MASRPRRATNVDGESAAADRQARPTPSGRHVTGCATATLALVFAVLALLTGTGLSWAQVTDPSVSHITPFPEKDVYRAYIIGDAMADGIAVGLADALRDETTLEFFKKTKHGSGFTRPDIQDWAAVVKETSAKERFHIAIVVMGAADRKPIPISGESRRPALVGTDDWKREYGRRVDEFLKGFRRSQAALYWVGLPVMKVAQASDDMQMINAIIREKVALHGGKFIDTWNGFADVNGQYSQVGPDISGKVKPLRDNDGVHFSRDGYRKLAHFVERDLRRDLAIAKAERNVPLAGSEAEQRRITQAKLGGRSGQDTLAPATAASTAPTAPASISASIISTAMSRHGATPPRDLPLDAAEPQVPAVDQPADSARVNLTITPSSGSRAETVAIDIVRPAISAQVISHVTRNANIAKPAPVGENMQQSLPGGLVVMSSVTTVTEMVGAARRSVPVTQTPHYKVMVKGEAMPAKPGRADDFRWPRDPQSW